jgi:hypothetical protein
MDNDQLKLVNIHSSLLRTGLGTGWDVWIFLAPYSPQYVFHLVQLQVCANGKEGTQLLILTNDARKYVSVEVMLIY